MIPLRRLLVIAVQLLRGEYRITLVIRESICHQIPHSLA